MLELVFVLCAAAIFWVARGKVQGDAKPVRVERDPVREAIRARRTRL